MGKEDGSLEPRDNMTAPHLPLLPNPMCSHGSLGFLSALRSPLRIRLQLFWVLVPLTINCGSHLYLSLPLPLSGGRSALPTPWTDPSPEPSHSPPASLPTLSLSPSGVLTGSLGLIFTPSLSHLANTLSITIMKKKMVFLAVSLPHLAPGSHSHLANWLPPHPSLKRHLGWPRRATDDPPSSSPGSSQHSSSSPLGDLWPVSHMACQTYRPWSQLPGSKPSCPLCQPRGQCLSLLCSRLPPYGRDNNTAYLTQPLQD